MMPCTQSTFSCCTSLLKRSIVSLGELSSSMTSSILRPAMPPAALNRSVAHWVARMPFSPGAAAIPERGARMPMRTGLFCAIAGATTSPDAANTPTAAADLSRLRRDRNMDSSLDDYCACGSPQTKASMSSPVSFQSLSRLAMTERLAKLYRPLPVVQAIEQDGERELLRALALVGPLEAESGEALDLVVLVEPLAIDRDDEPVDG